jgi:hypothetical protein
MPTATGQPAGHPVFLHQRSWTTSQLLWSLSVTAIFTPALLLAYAVRGVAWPLLVVAGLLVVLLVFGGCCTWEVRGAWRIQVTQEEVTWETPHNLHGNRGFRVRPSDIRTLMSERMGAGEPGGSSARRYEIVMANGDQYGLHQSLSGIDLDGFCDTLQQLGVTYCRHP